MEAKHNACTAKCIQEKKAYPRPLGCFTDDVFNRDLEYFLGGRMSPEDCMEQANQRGFTYVGL